MRLDLKYLEHSMRSNCHRDKLTKVLLLLFNLPYGLSYLLTYGNRIPCLQGDDLTLGSNWTTDGSVYVGGVNCAIDDVTRSRIHFHPPDLIADDMISLREANQNVGACVTTIDYSMDKITPAMLSVIFPLEVCALD